MNKTKGKIMKYLLKIPASLLVALMFFGFAFVLNFGEVKAEADVACMSDSDCPSGQTCQRSPAQVSAGQGGDCVASSATDDEPGSDTPASTTDTSGDDDDDDGDSGTGNFGLESVPSEVPQDEISDVIVRIVQYVLGFVGVILLVMIIYGGFLYMTSAGNEEQAKRAKSVLTYAIIGIVIIAFAFIITEFVINALTGGENGDTDATTTTTDDSDD